MGPNPQETADLVTFTEISSVNEISSEISSLIENFIFCAVLA